METQDKQFYSPQKEKLWQTKVITTLKFNLLKQWVFNGVLTWIWLRVTCKRKGDSMKQHYRKILPQLLTQVTIKKAKSFEFTAQFAGSLRSLREHLPTVHWVSIYITSNHLLIVNLENFLKFPFLRHKIVFISFEIFWNCSCVFGEMVGWVQIIPHLRETNFCGHQFYATKCIDLPHF